tara:strand:- start:3262 stop:4317 length:1056 start_codon:yes stop_codon:yes gene_type:complete
MNRFIKNIIIVLLTSILLGQSWTDYLRSPIKWTVGMTNGYDNNVLRLSDVEKQNAALYQDIMGGADTFDSHYTRFSLSGMKNVQLSDRKKQIKFYGKVNISNYSQNDNRRHWSGNIKATYRWGSYRKLEYSLRHLDSYYIRHYIDRDVSTDELASCNFTDREQRLLMSHPLKRRLWVTGFVSYTQRYFDKPFTEFDLDIVTTALKVSKKFRSFGTIAIEGKYGIADNNTFGETAKASELDRSYKHLEWFVPISYNQGLFGLDDVGFSMRRNVRLYGAETIGDPLHSGRSHDEIKLDIWGEKELGDNLTINGTVRYRKRTTNSQFDWVSELKTFDQVQAWVTLEWDIIYDRY